MAPLPEWLAPGLSVALPPRPRTSGFRCLLTGPVVALSALAGAFVPAVRGGTPLSVLDPRAKVAACAVLVVSTSFLHGIPALGAASAFALLAALATGARKTRAAGAFLAVPLLSAAILAPATFNLFSPGEAVLRVCPLPSWHLAGWVTPTHLAITREGLASAGRVLLRCAASSGFLLALTSCTAPGDLLGGLRALGLPRGAAATLRMMGRYLLTLAEAARVIHLAKLSRSLVPPPGRQGRAWVSASAADLFRKSRRLAGEVALAMASRGYRGQVRELPRPPWRGREWICLLLASASAGWLLLLDGAVP